MNNDDFPQIHFEESFDEMWAHEVWSRGWYGGVTVELITGKKVKVFFYDPVRLAQELESAMSQGFPFIAEKNMIVISEVTPEIIRKSINRLVLEVFFE